MAQGQWAGQLFGGGSERRASRGTRARIEELGWNGGEREQYDTRVSYEGKRLGLGGSGADSRRGTEPNANLVFRLFAQKNF